MDGDEPGLKNESIPWLSSANDEIIDGSKTQDKHEKSAVLGEKDENQFTIVEENIQNDFEKEGQFEDAEYLD